ncbi:MAG: CoA transferase [Dehalococcoidales bacterium]|nr:CoA transferase [Dehalococcoidales bacterium]
MTGLLEGVKVLDMGQVVAVPAAGGMMADWGAEVIKIEPLTGDTLRGARTDVGTANQPKPGETEIDWGMQLFNRNKKSLALDLKQEAGREIVYKLLKKYDIFMTNYKLSSVKKLKMDYDTLKKYNPALIYGILNAFGTSGPDKDLRGYDYTAVWARSGLQYLIGEPGFPPPAQRGGLMDRMVGAHILAGVLAALFHREKTGKGQEIEFSLYHTGVWAIAGDIQNALKGLPVIPNDRLHPGNPLSNNYFSKDGHWFRLSMLQADQYWASLLQAIEMPELLNNPKFCNMDVRMQNSAELVRLLDSVFSSREMTHWESRFRDNECTYGKVQTPAEVINDPQAIANGFFADLQIPGDGKVKVVNPPIKFKQNPAKLGTPAPELGQNTEEILLDIGYHWDDIANLKEQKIIL